MLGDEHPSRVRLRRHSQATEMTTSPTLSEFKAAVRDAFGYLEREFAFHEAEPPASLLEVNPFIVWFVNATTLVQVEGVNWGFAAQVLLGPAAAGHDWHATVPLWAILKHRAPDLYQRSATSEGQLGDVRFYADALRQAAGDVLRGDFRVIAPAHAVVEADASRQRLREREERQDHTKSAAVKAAADAFQRKDYRRVVEHLTPHMERLTPAERARLDYARAQVGRHDGAV
jgi:hypothetical protein